MEHKKPHQNSTSSVGSSRPLNPLFCGEEEEILFTALLEKSFAFAVVTISLSITRRKMSSAGKDKTDEKAGIRQAAEEMVVQNTCRRYRIDALAEREADLLKKKREVDAEMRLAMCQVTAKEEQLSGLKQITELQRDKLNSMRHNMFAEQEKRVNLDREIKGAKEKLNQLRISERRKREQRENRVADITARLRCTPWAIKRQKALDTMNTLKKELEENVVQKKVLVDSVEEMKTLGKGMMFCRLACLEQIITCSR
ncbi:unnamed protein product [Toxocara canis]|uniref:Trichohyalin-like n=1 Tax=Toxocara canis TaxID=6265 RepID=A0A183V244_TOXCA|nr:unnamed protein product [Toxocara canis]